MPWEHTGFSKAERQRFPGLVKSKEGARPKDDDAGRQGWEHVVEDVTVDADEQMLEKLDNGSQVRDASTDPQRCCASAASAAKVLSAARESGKQKCAEFVCEVGTVSPCDSSARETLPTRVLCHSCLGMRFLDALRAG